MEKLPFRRDNEQMLEWLEVVSHEHDAEPIGPTNELLWDELVNGVSE